MTEAAARPEQPSSGRLGLRRPGAIGAVVVAIGGVYHLLGWEIRGWVEDLWDSG
jgi:hypothetical protein